MPKDFFVYIKVAIWLCLSLFVCGGGWAIWMAAGGFCVAKLELQFPDWPAWEVELDPQCRQVLQQPYHFLGKGSQSYVFASQDGQYVIKLFRFDRVSHVEQVLPLLQGYKMAYDHLQEETGLLYVHLNVSGVGLPTLHARDGLHRSVDIPLDRYRFAIQRRVEPFVEAFSKAQTQDRRQELIEQFHDLLVRRTSKGFMNADPNLSRNFGFLGGRAMEIDFGNYRELDREKAPQEVARFMDKLHKWLEKHPGG